MENYNFFPPGMISIASNEFTIKDTFFAKEIVEQGTSLVMGNLDVDSLFRSIPLDKTIDICPNTIYSQ